MQVCIVYAGKDRNDKSPEEVCRQAAKGLGEQGHAVEIFNMYTDSDRKLSFYDYILVVSCAKTAFGGSIPDVVKTFLSRAGQVGSKRCSALVTKAGLRSQKTLSLLMKDMEAEGMFVLFGEVIKKPGTAYALGKRLNIERNI